MTHALLPKDRLHTFVLSIFSFLTECKSVYGLCYGYDLERAQLTSRKKTIFYNVDSEYYTVYMSNIYISDYIYITSPKAQGSSGRGDRKIVTAKGSG